MYIASIFVTALWALFLCTSVVDSVPTFAGTAVATGDIVENAAVGVVVTDTVTATGNNGTITYALKSQTPDSTPKKFSINGSTGSITVADTLDFERVKSYLLTISATDVDGSTDHNLTVSVTNVDEAPVFSVVNPNVTILDAAVNGTVLTTITAPDPENATVTFTINPTTDFAIHSTTGVITSTVVMNRTAMATYTLTVTATDPIKNSPTTIVTVSVTEKSGASFLHCGYMALLLSLLALLVR